MRYSLRYLVVHWVQDTKQIYIDTLYVQIFCQWLIYSVLYQPQSEVWTVEDVFLIGTKIQFFVLNGHYFSKRNGELKKQLKLVEILSQNLPSAGFLK